MGRSVNGRRRRVLDLRQRIEADDKPQFPICTIIGCGQKVHGVAVALCRKHLLHRQRHGSPFCRSPTAKALRPYLRAALAAIEANKKKDVFVSAAVSGLQNLMDTSGEVIIATRLNGLNPERRAIIALARLREAGVKPELLLAITLAVHALIQDNPSVTHRIQAWRVTAIAKAAHRRASGYHRIWLVHDESGRIVSRTEMHTYPRSSGRVLRYLGEAIEKQCEWVIERHLDQVVALKVAQDRTPHELFRE